MGRFDEVFESIGKTFSDASQTVVNKGRELSDVSRINSQIAEEQKRINSIYLEIGKRYVELFGDTSDDNFAELVNECKASMTRIEQYQDTIKKLKGITQCPNCGADLPPGTLFCPSCGMKLEIPQQNVSICGVCGAQLNPGSKFCTTCGSPVASAVNTQVNPVSEQAAPLMQEYKNENTSQEVVENVVDNNENKEDYNNEI